MTDDRLIADIADGYDVCVMGADKWHQLHDVSFYGGAASARAAALAKLPVIAVAPRDGFDLPVDAVILDLAPEHRGVSSTAIRDGSEEWRARWRARGPGPDRPDAGPRGVGEGQSPANAVLRLRLRRT